MSYELHITQEFEKWFSRIRDKSTKRRILARLDRVENCSFGDYEQVASNLFELRFFFGGGLRIYFTFRGNQIILLLVGGDKSSQRRDIARAQSLLDQMEE